MEGILYVLYPIGESTLVFNGILMLFLVLS